jgi:hypothetical protein
VLNIQTNLINLYANNLSAVATQAALVAGFAFTGVIIGQSNNGLASEILSYFYYFLFTISLVSALFVLSQATIVVMFGPTMALKGSSDFAVKYSATHMLAQQFIIFKAAALAISSILLAACIYSWSNYELTVCVPTTIVYIAGYYIIWTEGKKAFDIFIPNDDGAFVDPVIDSNSSDNNNRKSFFLFLLIFLYIFFIFCYYYLLFINSYFIYSF